MKKASWVFLLCYCISLKLCKLNILLSQYSLNLFIFAQYLNCFNKFGIIFDMSMKPLLSQGSPISNKNYCYQKEPSNWDFSLLNIQMHLACPSRINILTTRLYGKISSLAELHDYMRCFSPG